MFIYSNAECYVVNIEWLERFVGSNALLVIYKKNYISDAIRNYMNSINKLFGEDSRFIAGKYVDVRQMIIDNPRVCDNLV